MTIQQLETLKTAVRTIEKIRDELDERMSEMDQDSDCFDENEEAEYNRLDEEKCDLDQALESLDTIEGIGATY